jgi:hypothetical protein
LTEARCGQRRGHLGGHATAARDHPHRAGGIRLGGVLRRPADAAHLDHVRDDDPEAVRTDDARIALGRKLDHLRDVAARDPLGDDHDQLDVVLERLEHRILGERGGER